MENPELKEVLPYIPYNVQAQDEHGNLRTVTIEHQTYDQKTVGINHVLCNGLFFKRHTLVLRPISDLVKEIEHNGEKFVPIEMFEIGDDAKDFLEFDHGNIKLIRSLESLAKHAIVNDVNYLPFGVVQKLYEWHFKIFA